MRKRPFARTFLRGFTLVELMVVVMIIAVSAALSIPAIRDIVRSRRVQRTGAQLFAILQESRGRAFGRGSAVIVQWKGTNGGLLTVSEVQRDLDGDGDPEVPEPLCSAAAAPAPFGASTTKISYWTQSQNVEGNTVISTTTNAEVYPGAQPAVLGNLDLCFTPKGMLYQRAPVDTGPWVRANFVYSWRIQRAINGVAANDLPFVAGLGDRSRFVHVAPNGVARLSL